jgi:hypothetical protein
MHRCSTQSARKAHSNTAHGGKAGWVMKKRIFMKRYRDKKAPKKKQVRSNAPLKPPTEKQMADIRTVAEQIGTHPIIALLGKLAILLFEMELKGVNNEDASKNRQLVELAYAIADESAASSIVDNLRPEFVNGAKVKWYYLPLTVSFVSKETLRNAHYLELRGLLLHEPNNPTLVRVKERGE